MKFLKIGFFLCCYFIFNLSVNAQNCEGLASLKDLDPKVNLIRPYEGKLEVIKQSVQLKNINGDKIDDKAFITYKRIITPDSIYSKECGQNVCYCRIKFSSSKIPEMIIEGYSITLMSTFDINKDGKKEVLIFRELEQYNWGRVSIYSFYKNKWKLLGDVNVFLGDEDSYKNRILKFGSKYYILEDRWNYDFTKLYKKKILIKTNHN